MMVYQRLDVVAARHNVLQQLVDSRFQGFKIHYQDETWRNANHTRQYIWMLEEEEKDKENTRPDDKLLEDTQWKGGLKVNSFIHLCEFS